jgi:hypothetical protein
MSEWISVKERLPEPGPYVLICLCGHSVFVGRYSLHKHPKWQMGLETKSIMGVTHWMPLPGPPELA